MYLTNGQPYMRGSCISNYTRRKGYIRDYPRKYHGVALVECCLKKDTMKTYESNLNTLNISMEDFQKIMDASVVGYMIEKDDGWWFVDKDGTERKADIKPLPRTALETK